MREIKFIRADWKDAYYLCQQLEKLTTDRTLSIKLIDEEVQSDDYYVAYSEEPFTKEEAMKAYRIYLKEQV